MSDGRSSTVRRRPPDRRRRIIAAAAELADERGIGNVTLGDVAEAVGITTPALYRHIGSKEALTAAIAAAALETIADALERPGADASPVAVATALLDVAEDHTRALGAYLAIDPSYLAGQEVAATGLERRVVERLARVVDVEAPVLRLRLRAALAAAHAVVVRHAAEASRARSTIAGRLTVLLSGPAAHDSDEPEPPALLTPSEPARTALLRTAVRLFRERGYQAVGVDEIGAEAGVSGPSLYRHFSSKVDLLIEASDRSTIAVLEALEEILRGAPDTRAAAEAMADAYARIAVGNVDLIVVTAREAGNIPEDARRLHRQRRRSVNETWTDLLAPSQPELTRRSVEGLVAAGMAAARAAAVAGAADPAPASIVGESARAVRALTLGA